MVKFILQPSGAKMTKQQRLEREYLEKQINSNIDIWLEDICDPPSLDDRTRRPSFVPKLWDAYISGPVWFNDKSNGRKAKSASKPPQKKNAATTKVNPSNAKNVTVMKSAGKKAPCNPKAVRSNKIMKDSQSSQVNSRVETQQTPGNNNVINSIRNKERPVVTTLKRPDCVPKLWDEFDVDIGPIWYNKSKSKTSCRESVRTKAKTSDRGSVRTKAKSSDKGSVRRKPKIQRLARPVFVPKLWDIFDNEVGPIFLTKQQAAVILGNEQNHKKFSDMPKSQQNCPPDWFERMEIGDGNCYAIKEDACIGMLQQPEIHDGEMAQNKVNNYQAKLFEFRDRCNVLQESMDEMRQTVDNMAASYPHQQNPVYDDAFHAKMAVNRELSHLVHKKSVNSSSQRLSNLRERLKNNANKFADKIRECRDQIKALKIRNQNIWKKRSNIIAPYIQLDTEM